jgi:hypothetical protein
MTNLTVPASLGGSGTTYSDGSGANGMASSNGYGYNTLFFPAMAEVVTAMAAMLAAATTAVNSPGTGGTSTSSVAIGTGSKAFTTQTGKSWFVGQWVIVASNAAPSTNWMVGQITAYDTGTGALTVDVKAINGSGTIASWTISLTGPVALETNTTWLPGLTFGGGNTGMTIGTQVGRAWRVFSKFAFFKARVALTTKGSSTGTASMTGLPWSSVNVGSLPQICALYCGPNFTGLTGAPQGIISNNATSVGLVQTTSSGVASLTDAVFTATSNFYVEGWYETA